MRKVEKARLFFARAMLLTLSWGTFQIKGLYFFIIFQVIYCFLSLWKYRGKISFRFPRAIWFVLGMHLITFVSGLITDLPESFKIYSIIMTFVMIPTFVSFAYLMMDSKRGIFRFAEIIKWIKAGLLVQILYIPIQYILYKHFGIDSNNFIFSDLLHLMENASFVREDVWFPSGFTWHSAYIAPMLVVSVVLFSNNYIRLLILFDSYICGNSTALVGVVVAVGCMLFSRIMHMKKNIRRRTIKEIMIIILLAIIYLAGLGGLAEIGDKIRYFVQRTDINSSSSSAAHFSYYLLYPTAVNNQTIIENLFGTGYASSGYAISQINGQYNYMRHWVVECDIIDILVSKGMIGFIIYYFFLFYIASKGKKLDAKYLILMVAVMLQGIIYNVQFEYFFFIELLLCGSIAAKDNIFHLRPENEDRRKCLGMYSRALLHMSRIPDA